MSKSYIEESRSAWYREGALQPGDLQTGCLQRIAAAMELSCKDREKLERGLTEARRQRDYYRGQAEHSIRSNAALRGVIKRMKRLAAERNS